MARSTNYEDRYDPPTVGHAQDAVFERWDDPVVDEPAWSLLG
jgi:hypothetical protein